MAGTGAHGTTLLAFAPRVTGGFRAMMIESSGTESVTAAHRSSRPRSGAVDDWQRQLGLRRAEETLYPKRHGRVRDAQIEKPDRGLRSGSRTGTLSTNPYSASVAVPGVRPTPAGLPDAAISWQTRHLQKGFPPRCQ